MYMITLSLSSCWLIVSLWCCVYLYFFYLWAQCVQTLSFHSTAADALVELIGWVNRHYLWGIQGVPVPPLVGLRDTVPPLFRTKGKEFGVNRGDLQILHTLKPFSAGASPRTPLGESSRRLLRTQSLMRTGYLLPILLPSYLGTQVHLVLFWIATSTF